jgi:hypothetical protein
MTYNSIREMATSPSLLARIAASAAQQGIDNPVVWANDNMWKLAASPAWDDKWDYAKATQTPNVNPDTGARNDVISDGDILSAVQAAMPVEG